MDRIRRVPPIRSAVYGKQEPHTLHFGGVDSTQERPCTQQTVSINVIQDVNFGVWTRKSGATSLFQLKFSFSISSISDLKVKVRPVSF